jgi:hypothetical protein
MISIFILSTCLIAGILLYDITPKRTLVSPKDVGQRFRVIKDKKFDVVLQQCDEETHLVIASTEILNQTSIGKIVEIKDIKYNMPICN